MAPNRNILLGTITNGSQQNISYWVPLLISTNINILLGTITNGSEHKYLLGTITNGSEQKYVVGHHYAPRRRTVGDQETGLEKVWYPGILVTSQCQIWQPILAGPKALTATI